MRRLTWAALALASCQSQANVIQYFTGISYNNPAELYQVQNSLLLVGGTGFYVDARFEGTVLNFNTFQYDGGVNHSRTTSLLPYGRVAKRLNNMAVFAVDVTQPFHSNLRWGEDAFTRYAAVHTLLTDTDISPKIGLSLTKQLYAGGGLNFNFLKNNETNWALPTGPSTYSTLLNRTSSFGLGYNAGLSYLLNQTNFLGLTYYSRIRQSTRGYSTLGPIVNNDLIFNFTMPATTVLSYTHLFSPTWLVSMQAFYSEWNANQVARFFNTAAQPPLDKDFAFTMQYDAAWAYLAVLRNQYNDKWAFSLAGFVDRGPEVGSLRTINFPSDTQFLGGLIAEYNVNKQTTLQVLYAHVFSKTMIYNRVAPFGEAIPFTTGRVRINAEVLDLRLKIVT